MSTLYEAESLRERQSHAELLTLVQKQQAAIDDLLYIADHKADLTKPVGQWWSEVIRGAIERHMGPVARTVAEDA